MKNEKVKPKILRLLPGEKEKKFMSIRTLIIRSGFTRNQINGCLNRLMKSGEIDRSISKPFQYRLRY